MLHSKKSDIHFHHWVQILLPYFDMNEVEFKHPSLGAIRGLKHDLTTQFLGLQYATLEGKFDQAQLNTSTSSDAITDATKLGYASPGAILLF